jgi:sulfite exporter TauE/SafE
MGAETNLLAIFTTGLFVGGLSCIAVQGGLLTASLAQREQEHLEDKAKNGTLLPILSFLIAKLLAYTLLGALLGWFGSLLQLSIPAQITLQALVILFMIGTALNLLNVHPVFRYFVIQPPRFLTRFIHKQSKRKDFFAPALLGAFTVFIPCGTTQAIMALAITTGSPVMGALMLAAFVLGTMPVFFMIGYFTMRLGDFLKSRFMKVAAGALLLLALFNFNSVLALTGTPYTFSNMLNNIVCTFSYCQNDLVGTPVLEQTITITPTGYTPNTFTVPRNSSVVIHLVNDDTSGCLQAFTIPSLNLQKIVAPNSLETFAFNSPDEPGIITFMCSMGMYAGTIRVI